MREMTQAVDTARKQEHRAFLRVDGDSPLTKTKYFWLFSEEHLTERHATTFATVQALELKVGRAWAIKEALRTLWTYPARGRGATLLSALVRLGDPLTSRAREESRPDDPQPSRRRAAVREASDYELRITGPWSSAFHLRILICGYLRSSADP
jgi:hypothetical protein